MRKNQKMSESQREKISNAKTIDLVGERFGKLVVVSKSLKRGNKGQIKWNCKCDCGKTHTVTGESLRGGKSKSCGCWRKNNPNSFKKHKNRENVLLKKQYSAVIKRHNYRWPQDKPISFNLFCELVYQPCFYCGIPSKNGKCIEDYSCDNKKKKKLSEIKIFINGVDRIDSSIGYIDGNVLPCCKICNLAKNDMSKDIFLEWIKRVNDFNFK